MRQKTRRAQTKRHKMCIFVLKEKGIVFADSKNYDEAFKCFDKSIEIDSSLTSSYFHKANLLKELGRLDEAIKYYDIVIDKDPKDVVVNVLLKLYDFIFMSFINDISFVFKGLQ